MIPRLFEKSETTFTNYGICPLIDAISCRVTEERNGGYTLDMEYPRDGQWADEIIVDRIILADPYDNASQAEPFRINEVTFDMNGDISVQAEHISYQLNYVMIGQFTINTKYPAKAWEYADAAKLTTNAFSFTTDISDDNGTVYAFGSDYPVSLRSLIGGQMLDDYGGELKWNRYAVNLLASRGSDNGVKIAYTKNLTGLTYDIDLSSLITGAVAYYSSGGTYVEGAVQTTTNSYSFNRVVAVDATQYYTDLGSTPTLADLNTYASSWLASNASDPSVSVDVQFVPLWQTDEYKDFYGLEHVALCDTVQVVYPPLGINVSAKVVKTVYNVLADRYDEITISTIKPTLADTIFALMKG